MHTRNWILFLSKMKQRIFLFEKQYIIIGELVAFEFSDRSRFWTHQTIFVDLRTMQYNQSAVCQYIFCIGIQLHLHGVDCDNLSSYGCYNCNDFHTTACVYWSFCIYASPVLFGVNANCEYDFFFFHNSHTQHINTAQQRQCNFQMQLSINFRWDCFNAFVWCCCIFLLLQFYLQFLICNNAIVSAMARYCEIFCSCSI